MIFVTRLGYSSDNRLKNTNNAIGMCLLSATDRASNNAFQYALMATISNYTLLGKQ